MKMSNFITFFWFTEEFVNRKNISLANYFLNTKYIPVDIKPSCHYHVTKSRLMYSHVFLTLYTICDKSIYIIIVIIYMNIFRKYI